MDVKETKSNKRCGFSHICLAFIDVKRQRSYGPDYTGPFAGVYHMMMIEDNPA
jgi:hypothetical protein